MASKQFKKVLFIRFAAYCSVFIGLGAILFQFGPLIIAEANYRKDRLFQIQHRLSPTVITSSDLNQSTPSAQASTSPSTDEGGFGSLIGLGPSTIKPVSTNFGIVIEKINANALVIPEVDPGNEKAYTDALSKGVAAAKGSTNPGEPGNLFIFSHSADAPWNISRFNAIFYLLRELEKGDKVIIFYQGKRYDYIVFDKTVVNPSDVSYLQYRYDQPVLTLQTCDPPGTLNNRLIVRAKLEGF